MGVYNEVSTLPATAKLVVERLHELPGSELVLVENGSTDGSSALVDELARDLSDARVAVRSHHSPKGLGNALRRGIAVATADRLVLTAADLPFGFSDLDATLELDTVPDIVVGSKTHPGSKVETNALRDVMSVTFRLIRRALFGLRLGDTQGSINIERDLAHRLLPHLESEGYFISTELIVLAAATGATISEVPVDYSNPRGDSKVRPIHDSTEVLGAMWRLRGRLRNLRPELVS